MEPVNYKSPCPDAEHDTVIFSLPDYGRANICLKCDRQVATPDLKQNFVPLTRVQEISAWIKSYRSRKALQ